MDGGGQVGVLSRLLGQGEILIHGGQSVRARDDAVFEPAEIDLVLRLEITPLRGDPCVPDKLGIGFIGAEMQLVHDRFPREVVVLGTIGRPR